MSNHREKSTSGMRSWKMRIFLVWTLFPGGWAVTGPVQVTAEQGSSLAVSCSYEQGYELYPKYWCRPKFLWFCFTYIAQTNGSEGTMTQGRVSIRDNHIARSFMVTLGHVTPGDAGWYSCRVRRSLWFSLGHNTEVMVSAGKASLGAKQGACGGACHLGQSSGDRASPGRGTQGLSKREQGLCRHREPLGAAPVQIWMRDGGGCRELHAELPFRVSASTSPSFGVSSPSHLKPPFPSSSSPVPSALPGDTHLHLLHLHSRSLGAKTHREGGRTGCGGLHFARTLSVFFTAVSTTSEGSNVSPLATNTLCPMCCGEPPVLSQLGITHLLLFLGAKLSVALVLVCGAAWVRCRRRNHDQENLQLLEEADSTRAPGGPLTPEPQGHPPAPFPPTLPALHQPSRPPRTRSCLALGPPPPVKPWPLLAAPELEGGEFGVQRAYVC
ncbi:uncharacterized protein LOC142065150 isoform X1 [Phalacrocorax aristotelis]|uniref:uncharacterized protein LOC142065150 isoform X1 n=1 Tax=Phalacrocorax aristotelis TaxID=126867 RepID=UPI003F4C4BD4